MQSQDDYATVPGGLVTNLHQSTERISAVVAAGSQPSKLAAGAGNKTRTRLLKAPSRVARSLLPPIPGAVLSRFANPREEMPNGADQLYRPGHRRRHFP
jgi:hypothetical protein